MKEYDKVVDGQKQNATAAKQNIYDCVDVNPITMGPAQQVTVGRWYRLPF